MTVHVSSANFKERNKNFTQNMATQNDDTFVLEVRFDTDVHYDNHLLQLIASALNKHAINI